MKRDLEKAKSLFKNALKNRRCISCGISLSDVPHSGNTCCRCELKDRSRYYEFNYKK